MASKTFSKKDLIIKNVAATKSHIDSIIEKLDMIPITGVYAQVAMEALQLHAKAAMENSTSALDRLSSISVRDDG